MTPLLAKLVQCFYRAKQVVHFYFVHTTGDQADGKTSVENIKRIIERLIGLPIEVYRAYSDGPSVRGNFERYIDRIVILVRAGQADEWERFTVIKELCHALMDIEEEFSTDGVETIRDLVTHQGFVEEDSSPQVRSEHLAERMALELIYPLEFRRADLERRTNGDSYSEIAGRRGVPITWVERALDEEHINACQEVWAVLPEITTGLGPQPEPRPEPYYRIYNEGLGKG